MKNKVFVTGIGIIAGIGLNAGETLESLRSGRSGIGKMKYLNTVWSDEFPVSEVKANDNELAQIVGSQSPEGFTRTALLGMIAASEAVAQAGIKNIKEVKTGLISATTVGGMGKTEIFYNDFLKNNQNLIYVYTHDCGDSTEKIADYLNIRDFVTTVSTACSSSLNSIMFASRLIRNGALDRAVAGGSDSLTKYTLNGFNTLMILDREPCKPFDENRKGLNLGEGAAFMMLESEKSMNKRGVEPICEIAGYGNACDAYHQTASSPDGKGAYLAMKRAVESAGIKPSDINYVNVHGTGTENNDLSEGRAITQIFEGKQPLLSSTKPFTGHTLGAAGAVEAVISALSIRNRTIFPNMNFSERMKELEFSPVTKLIENIDLKYVMTNSFGFGGNNTSLILARC